MTAAITETVRILKINGEKHEHREDIVVTESSLTIVLNGEELVTLVCSPQHLDYLAIGFLASEGLVWGKEDIKKISVDECSGVVQVNTTVEPDAAPRAIFKRLITSSCGQSAAPYGRGGMPSSRIISAATVSPVEVFVLMKKFQQHCTIFRETGGVHAAALCDRKEILVFHEDIGRHNAIDKVLGQCLVDNIATQDKLLLTSGRMSSEVVLKAARRNIPLLISKSPPTSLAVAMANDLGITIIGFVRGQHMNIYANEWRVTSDEGPRN